MQLHPNENMDAWYDRDAGVSSLSFGAPGSGADVELPTLEALDPASAEPSAEAVDALATQAAEAGLEARARVREVITDLVMGLPAEIREQLERELRASPTGSARADLDDTVTTMEFAAALTTDPAARRQLKLSQGYLRALAERALGFEAAVMRCIRLVGQMLVEDVQAPAGLADLGGLLQDLEFVMDDSLREDVTADLRLFMVTIGRGERLQLTDDGVEHLGLLLGRFLLLPERRWVKASDNTNTEEGPR